MLSFAKHLGIFSLVILNVMAAVASLIMIVSWVQAEQDIKEAECFELGGNKYEGGRCLYIENIEDKIQETLE